MPLKLALLNGGKRKGTQNDHVQKPKGKTGEHAVARGQQEVSDHLADSHEDRVGLQREVGATRESEG